MMKIKCAIVDDQIDAAKSIEDFILKMSQFELVGIFTDSKEAFSALKTSDVYVIFMDINMNGINGFEMASLLKHIRIVFITGNETYGTLAWNLENVIGYLIKPVFIEDLQKIYKRISAFFVAETVSKEIPNGEFLVFERDNDRVQIPHEDIVYMQAKYNYTIVHVSVGEYLVPIPLSHVLKTLPKDKFIRINRSTVARDNKIIKVKPGEITLLGGVKVKPGKAYKTLDHF